MFTKVVVVRQKAHIFTFKSGRKNLEQQDAQFKLKIMIFFLQNSNKAK